MDKITQKEQGTERWIGNLVLVKAAGWGASRQAKITDMCWDKQWTGQHSQRKSINKEWLWLSGNLSNIILFTLLLKKLPLYKMFNRKKHSQGYSQESRRHWYTATQNSRRGLRKRQMTTTQVVYGICVCREQRVKEWRHKDRRAVETWSCQSSTAVASQRGSTQGGGRHQLQRHYFALFWFLAGLRPSIHCALETCRTWSSTWPGAGRNPTTQSAA